MKCIVGLGNPGKKYELTRHNLGRLLIQFLAETYKASWVKKPKWKARVCEFFVGDEKVFLVAPETYMNLSGFSVNQAVRFLDIDTEKDLLVAVDDLDLPFEKIRLRASGGTGGHNGLASISAALCSSDFARLRLGIGRPSETVNREDAVSEFVLSPFGEDEKKRLKDFLEKASQACLYWFQYSIDEAMNQINSCS